MTRDPTALDPTALDPNALDPNALDPTALDPTLLDPTALDPTALDPTYQGDRHLVVRWIFESVEKRKRLAWGTAGRAPAILGSGLHGAQLTEHLPY